MTSCIVLSLVDRYHLDMDSVYIKILTACTTLGGTSAELQPGDKLTIRELLYGMMLPSGNDAAQSLGVYFGHLVDIMMGQDKKIPDNSGKNSNHRGVLCDANINEDEYPESDSEDES